MNQDSEQIRPDLSLEVAQDQVLTPHQQEEQLIKYLGKENCSIKTIIGKNVFVYSKNGTNFILLHKAVHYLGNPHPIFKKRVQLPSWYKDFCLHIVKNKLLYDVRFIGIYHYQGAVVFVDFIKDTYLRKIIHNSSAHIYINDIYQAFTNGVFHKEDSFGNHIYTIRGNKLSNYLSGKELGKSELFALFEKFNNGFSFGQWLRVLPTVKEMQINKWPEWRQTEWPGWYLEYLFNQFINDNDISSLMKYTGQSNKSKKNNEFDFDIWFPKHCFYGDLKASDITAKEAPGNDQRTFVECVNMCGKFWYIIYEHETEKDSEVNNYKNVRAYNKFISTVSGGKKKDELSYAARLKTGVKFLKMIILELNRVNYREALTEFNQGHQPDGSARNPKFLIKKKDIDRFVVFRYSYNGK
ncbi:MAG: hypothetical protein K6B46_04620 [Opitutales bacterium]|nr:hypothetical protein [Opitutales bacterium]